MKRCFAMLSMITAAYAAPFSARAQNAPPAALTRRATVVELYTSEGCSSCPPAEAVLKDLAARPDVIALAFHVDYWDGLGWRDRFSSPLATSRQERYAESLGLSSAFTPQAVIGGRDSVLGSDRRRIAASLATEGGVDVGLTVAGGTLTVTVPATAARSTCDVSLVAYLSHASTAVGRGENAGRTLEEFNIVREFRRLGSWQGDAGSTFAVPLASLPADADHVAVLVQRSHQGAVEGAATVNLR